MAFAPANSTTDTGTHPLSDKGQTMVLVTLICGRIDQFRKSMNNLIYD